MIIKRGHLTVGGFDIEILQAGDEVEIVIERNGELQLAIEMFPDEAEELGHDLIEVARQL